MKNKLYFSFMLFGFLSFFVGCLKTRNDVKEVEESKVLQSQVVTMQRANADYVSRVEESLENYRALTGRVEVLENNAQKTVGAEAESQTGNSLAITELNEKIKLLQDSISKLEEESQALQNELAGLKGRAGKKIDSKASVERETQSAIFLAAEDLFRQKKWKEAILQYDTFKKKSPKDKDIPESIYKTGVCFQELGMKDEAKVFYQEVVSKFPKSAFVRKSQIRLKSI